MRISNRGVFGLVGGMAASFVATSALAQGKGITDVSGIRVGHYTMPGRPTGCTVILVDGEGAAGGVSQRGAAPGTRETDLLNPLNTVDKVNAVLLTGGSAYGLDAASGVMKYLEEKKTGYPVGVGVVPIVPAAVIFDLPFGGDPKIRPNADCGYRAASDATNGPIKEGNIGVGAGATVGKLGRAEDRRSPMKSGVGTASIALPSGLVVGAIVAVNAVGDVIDPQTGKVVAGVRNADNTLADARKLLRAGAPIAAPRAGENTTIAVVATNARLTKTQASRFALMADDGLARAITPSHTQGDGDTVFGLATGTWDGAIDMTTIGGLAADVLAEAIVRAAARADSSHGLVSAKQTGTIPARIK
jgi:L-aminopeptidase/D-esterase-like protein